jgi:hypothetical protein
MTTLANKFLRWSATAALMAAVVSTGCLGARAEDKKKHEENKPVPSYYGPQPATETIDLTMYARIREEGFHHGKVMEFGGALADGIGQRLTGSPNMAKANAWTRDTLTSIGLSNAHLEDWGEFGMGWQQINTWARMVSPDPEPLWMQASPWSPATKGPVSGEVVYVPLTDAKELDALKGKLAGKIVLLGAMRPTPDITKPLFTRYTDADLKEMESYEAGAGYSIGSPAFRKRYEEYMQRAQLRKQALAMMASENVAAIITPSRDGGDGGGTGIIFDDNGADLTRDAQTAANAVKIPNAVMMIEHYNRLARMAEHHVPVTVEVNIETKFTGDHEHGFDTVAEIPGTDPELKDQVVMVGGHLDSWIAGTGATDNGAGTIVAMEAVRILKALDVKPRRTIRIALWSGEEEGLYGSQGYVKQHFGTFAPPATPDPAGMPSFMGHHGALKTTARARSAACIRRATSRLRRSSRSGLLRSPIWALRRSRIVIPAGPITCRSMRSDCPASSTSRTRWTTRRARTTRTWTRTIGCMRLTWNRRPWWRRSSCGTPASATP